MTQNTSDAKRSERPRLIEENTHTRAQGEQVTAARTKQHEVTVEIYFAVGNIMSIITR